MPDSAKVEAVTIPGRLLAGNPLRDPALRRAAVILPSAYTPGKRLPIVYWLPGFGGSSEDILKNPGGWSDMVQRLSEKGAPHVFVGIDGRNRWGGSQYIDSTAQGDYGRYICEEIVPFIEARYGSAPGPAQRTIAGHSSGGFGALRLGMSHKHLFGRIAALSPDSDFPTTHRSIVEDNSVKKVSPADVEALMSADPSKSPRLGGEGPYVAALSAAYAPLGRRFPGKFEWPYDAVGAFQERVWKRWLDSDPLEIVRRNPHAFAPDQSVYLDGGATDEFKANIGAAKIYDVMKTRRSRATFYESPGGHGDHLLERIERALLWLQASGGPVK